MVSGVPNEHDSARDEPGIEAAPRPDETRDDQGILMKIDELDEEIPRRVMIALVVLAVAIAVLYIILGGGHSHFH